MEILYDIFGHDTAAPLEIDDDKHVITRNESERRIIYILIMIAISLIFVCLVMISLNLMGQFWVKFIISKLFTTKNL